MAETGAGWLVKLLVAAMSSPVLIKLFEGIISRKNDEQLLTIRAEFTRVNTRLDAIERQLELNPPSMDVT